MNHLPVRRNAQVALRKAKNLIKVTDRILAGRGTRLAVTDDGWIQRLWDWADENNIPDLTWVEDKASGGYWKGLPRDKHRLLDLPDLSISVDDLMQELGITWDEFPTHDPVGLTELPPEIGKLVNLKSLQLFENQLTELPPEIGKLVNLEDLTIEGNPLTDNRLTELPPEIGSLVNLKWLWLHSNRLTGLPPEIGGLVNLSYLYLSSNRLTKLPPEIGNLVNLVTLDLSGGNRLTELPPEIGNLLSLRELPLQNNQLSELPDEITRLANLKKLKLTGNPLRLSNAQREWIAGLEANGCKVSL